MTKRPALPGLRRATPPKPPSRPSPRVERISLPAGRRVGRCLLFAEFARGGMATVHLGRWLGGGGFSRTVAVKALHKQFASDPHFVDMLLDEARVVARITHPNVVPTIDLIDESGELFIVMDYVEGVTLSRLQLGLQKRGERLAPGVALRIAADALQGLHAAHMATDSNGESMGIIHRDVSPENILVGTDGYARLIDFGIARALGRSTVTQQGVIKGKPSYVAPEQLLGNELGPYTDVYSASVVLWQALTGRKLFYGNTAAEQVFNILRQPVAPPSSFAEGLSASLDRLVLRGLARKPARRWPSTQAMAEALERHGGLATHRKVGELVRAVHAEQLDQRAALVRAIENAPVAEQPRTPLRVSSAPRDSIPDRLTIDVEDSVVDEPSRTTLTSEADAGAHAPGGRVSTFTVAAVAAVVALAVAAAMSAVSSRNIEPEQSASPSATPSQTVVDETPPQPAEERPPQKGIAAELEVPASASAEPSAKPPAKKKKRQPKAKPRRFMPYDI